MVQKKAQSTEIHFENIDHRKRTKKLKERWAPKIKIQLRDENRIRHVIVTALEENQIFTN